MTSTPEKSNSGASTPISGLTPTKKSSSSSSSSEQEVGNKDLQITPRTLHFPPPLNRPIINVLRLQNLTSKSNPDTALAVAFKIKTTRPNRYSVRPHLGVIKPGESIDVEVRLNFNKDPVTAKDRSDKFQVESINIKDLSLLENNNNNFNSIEHLQHLFKSTPPDNIIKEKLKSRFVAVAARPGSTTSSSSGLSTNSTTSISATTSSSNPVTTSSSSSNINPVTATGMNSSTFSSTSHSSTSGPGALAAGSGGGGVDVLNARIKELESSNARLEAARKILMDKNALARKNEVMGLPKSVWILVGVVALISFILGIILI